MLLLLLDAAGLYGSLGDRRRYRAAVAAKPARLVSLLARIIEPKGIPPCTVRTRERPLLQ